MKIQESGEMYLESILILSKSKKVRSIDVAEHMGFSKPSVSRAVGILKEQGYIEIDDGYLYLTETGREVAESVYEKHLFITDVLEKMGVNHDTAALDACRIEHVISDESFSALKEHVIKTAR